MGCRLRLSRPRGAKEGSNSRLSELGEEIQNKSLAAGPFPHESDARPTDRIR